MSSGARQSESFSILSVQVPVDGERDLPIHVAIMVPGRLSESQSHWLGGRPLSATACECEYILEAESGDHRFLFLYDPGERTFSAFFSRPAGDTGYPHVFNGSPVFSLDRGNLFVVTQNREGRFELEQLHDFFRLSFSDPEFRDKRDDAYLNVFEAALDHWDPAVRTAAENEIRAADRKRARFRLRAN